MEFTDDVKNYRFNTAIAKLREMVNNILKKKLGKNLHNYCWSIFLRLISIITPHFSDELAQTGGYKESLINLKWPDYDKSSVNSESVNIVIQINGKKKNLINVPSNLEKESLLKIINESEDIPSSNYVNAKKVIFIKNKIINFVI